MCAGLPRPGGRIRCLDFGQELKDAGGRKRPLVPTHRHARRRWNGAVLFAENPRRPGTTNGGGSFPSRLSGAEPSPSAPFFRRRGVATAGVAQGRWPLPASRDRTSGLGPLPPPAIFPRFGKDPRHHLQPFTTNLVSKTQATPNAGSNAEIYPPHIATVGQLSQPRMSHHTLFSSSSISPSLLCPSQMPFATSV